MPFARLIDQFDERAGRCTSQAELAALLGDAVRELDFDHFALLHHASLRAGGAGLIRLDNYPSGWSLELVASGFAPDDPVHLACGRTNIGPAARRDDPSTSDPLAAFHDVRQPGLNRPDRTTKLASPNVLYAQLPYHRAGEQYVHPCSNRRL